jgi:hypothetical protein
MGAIATFLFFLSVAAILTVNREAGAKEQATTGNAESAGIGGAETRPKEGLVYNEEAGLQYVKDDFTWTGWAYAERAFSDERGYWRRVRQGMEFQFPRFKGEILGNQYRPTFVYEVDFTDNDFFRESKKFKIWENLYVTLQNAEDPNKLRLLFGENTHILSREDNLSSGNLTTINRSLILEEHGTVNNFGTQFGTLLQVSTNPHTLFQFSLQDNTGSLNTDDPQYSISNDFAARMTHILIENAPKKNWISVLHSTIRERSATRTSRCYRPLTRLPLEVSGRPRANSRWMATPTTSASSLGDLASLSWKPCTPIMRDQVSTLSEATCKGSTRFSTAGCLVSSCHS